MKKLLIMLFLACLGYTHTMAQSIHSVELNDGKHLNNTKFSDNWYFGVNGGGLFAWGNALTKADFLDRFGATGGLQLGKKVSTAGEVRHYFDKFGGNLGTSGCVSFLFTTKGVVVLDNEDEDIDEDKAMEDILEAGGDDFTFEDGCVEITTDPNTVTEVGKALEDMGYKVLSAEPAKIPSTYTTLTDEDHIKKMGLLLDALDDNDDVQNVWHNWDEQ